MQTIHLITIITGITLTMTLIFIFLNIRDSIKNTYNPKHFLAFKISFGAFIASCLIGGIVCSVQNGTVMTNTFGAGYTWQPDSLNTLEKMAMPTILVITFAILIFRDQYNYQRSSKHITGFIISAVLLLTIVISISTQRGTLMTDTFGPQYEEMVRTPTTDGATHHN